MNATNAPVVMREIEKLIGKYPDRRLTIDVIDLELISSAGLRGLVSLNKKLKDKILITNASLVIYEIFFWQG